MNIIIKEWENKTSKKTGKPYFLFNQEFFCWDLELAEDLMRMKDKEVSVEITEKGGFRSIKSAFPSEVKGQEDKTKQVFSHLPLKKPSDSTRPLDNRELTMYVSYAKDIFAAIIDNMPYSTYLTLEQKEKESIALDAINFVKMARIKLQEV